MQSGWIEFAAVALAHALAVASPGPDFALVLRQSLVYGRRTAVWTSLGIGAGILVHVSASLVGLTLVLQRSPAAFHALRYAGAAYLAWLGWQAWRHARPRPVEPAGATPSTGAAPGGEPAAGRAWLKGFLTNVLNPKAAVFFLALFPVAVGEATPGWVRAGYGLWMAVTTAAWFSLVSFVFARPAPRAAFLSHGHWLDRVLGTVFIVFAASLLIGG